MDDDTLAVFRRRQVGLIYQFYNLIPVLTVEENMTLIQNENDISVTFLSLKKIYL